MTYQETLEFLYAQLPMFSRIGAAAYKKDINNTILLCEALGNPQNKFKSIHIAGTNGKGSTSSMLAATLQQQGYKTGLYTSPHIKDFGERIRINGQMIDPEFVISFVEKTIPLCNKIKPSFFELTVAMAFEYFAKENVDIAIIETGLGGRLDSTNIISPILSIITNIGSDHTNLLGNTIEEIAMEKAGIIKRNTSVVIGEANTKTKNIFLEKAASLEAPIYFATDHYEVTQYSNQSSSIECNVIDKISLHEERFKLDLTGHYQLKNLCTVLMAEKLLHNIGFDISNENEKWALQNVKKITGLKGRWEIINEAPSIIMDVAHNKDGIIQILNQLQTQYTKSNYHFVLGFVNDKDINEILDLLPRSAQYYFTNAHIARALPHQELKALAHSKNLIGESYDDVNDAIAKAKINATSADVIMICGSFFVLSEVDENQISSNLEKP
jgi:dihydrofolate synthase/folylpolyglutamate synthase